MSNEPTTRASAPIFDDKAHVRGKLDLTNAEWQRAAEPDADPDGEYVEIAFVPHTDDKTYIAMRNSKHTGPDDTVLVFTESEWDAFVAGAKAGEFDEPW
ncbi:DUF397 domain-containing protein [Actinophytocola sp.]|jgi:uncharacterized protein DUF397|uniref:DUF397 domain-containing protein n=1 Tax=Actinophytocola sp. TaxID=1872138 RepID=UPI002D434490|nr:DUF397 domain-containing protein [Actinophytocola sp.]HYQ65227.1 DUF397 domain-containing protein [Actinophytocola sp.]